MLRDESVLRIPARSLLVLVLIAVGLRAQVTELEHLGQTPGGASYNVMYDSLAQRVYTGCGTSIWVYDATNLDSLRLIAMRPLEGMVNQMILKGNVLFAAATHDGLWALDARSETLRTLAHYPTPGDSAAYDLKLVNDTLYLAAGHRGIVLTYDSLSGFTEQARLGAPAPLAPDVYALARRGDAVAAGSRGLLNGAVALYRMPDLTTPVAVWQGSFLSGIQDLQFADRRDDILYVCAGSDNGGFTGRFYALKVGADTLYPVDSFKVSGIPGYAAACIFNMDTRHDTLFLVTMGAPYETMPPVPVSEVPVFDATGLPDDTMRLIGRICPGLWHFSIALIDRPPRRYAAIASEWLGVLMTEVTNLRPLDTLGFTPTGGACNGCRPGRDTLWGWMEGYGLVAYNQDRILYSAGFQPDFKLLHLPTIFTTDATWIDDTLLYVAYGAVCGIYDMAPWRAGGQPVRLDSFRTGGYGIACQECISTDQGKRLVSGLSQLLGPGRLDLRAPYGGQGYPILDSLIVTTQPSRMAVSGDTIFVGATIDSTPCLCAYRVTGDRFTMIAHTPTPLSISAGRITKEGDVVAMAGGYLGGVWFRFTGDTFRLLGQTNGGPDAVDVRLAGGLLYVAEHHSGVRVYRFSDSLTAELIATSPGTGGWQGGYGTDGVEVGEDGTIYLCDYHGGVFVIEPVPLAVAERTPHKEDAILQVSPSVTRGVVAITFALACPGTVELDLYDAAGRLVRRLVSGRLPPGTQFLTWDGRDDHGHRVNDGIYFCSLAAGRIRLNRKLAVITGTAR